MICTVKHIYFSFALLNKAINHISSKFTHIFGLSQMTRLNAHCLPIDTLLIYVFTVCSRVGTHIWIWAVTILLSTWHAIFSIIESNCEYVQWFKLSKSLGNLGEDVILVNVYIPSDNYFSQEFLEQFYTELHVFHSRNKYVIIIGDFNARTSNSPDHLPIDIYLFGSADSDIWSNNRLWCSVELATFWN